MLSSSDEKALEIYKRSIVIDASCATFPNEFTQNYYEKLKDGGVTGVVVTVPMPWENFREAIDRLCEWNEVCTTLGRDRVAFAATARDLPKAKAEDKVAIIYGTQSANPIESDIRLLSIFHRLGVRVMILAYQRRNLIADGASERTDSGLSTYGIQVVEEMNKLGIVVDLSHTGYRSSMEAMEISKEPVIFSHSNVRALCDHFRNLSDEQIKALAENGGVMGIVGASMFLRKGGDTKGTVIEDYLDHIEYVVDLVGVDHIGLGLDIREEEVPESPTRQAQRAIRRIYPEFTVTVPVPRNLRYPTGLNGTEKLFNVAKGLAKRGYSEEEIKKIMGGNFLRIFEKVWKT